MPSILLTFDVEEFDIPEEYGQTLDWQTKMDMGTQGLISVNTIIESYPIVCTLFTTAKFAQDQSQLIKQLSNKHEIASHGYDHSHFEVSHLKLSKNILEQIIEKPITGYRMARLAPVDDLAIQDAGYEYNSSMNPTWIPGRYNNLSKPRSPYFVNNVLTVPTSVTPNFRIPLFWLTIKNFPMWWIKRELVHTLKHDGFLSLYFHPWEFISIDGYELPGYIANKSGAQMSDRLHQIIELLLNEGEFKTMQTFSRSFSQS
jgi:hypothetical protein